MQTMEKATQASPDAPPGHRRGGRQPHFPPPVWGFWLALAWLLAAPLGHGAGTNYLSWKDSRVSADIQSWDLSQVLERITAETRWQVYVDPEAHLEIQAKFKNLSVSQALGMLLGNLNYALLPAGGSGAKLYVFRTSVHEATQLVKNPVKSGDKSVIGNELLVALKPGSKLSAQELAKSLGAQLTGEAGKQGVYRLRFTSEEAAHAARETLAGQEEVASVENNRVFTRPTQMDPVALSSLPGLNLKPAGPANPNQLVIGLIDTAVQAQGARIGDYLLPSVSVAGNSATDPASPSHGTSMAETILKSMSQTSPGKETMPVRILPVDVYGNSEETSTFDVARGIWSAAEGGAKIINLSLGGEGDSPLLKKIVAEAHQQGIVLVAAAGNESSTQPRYPAAYPEVISVTAGDRKGQLASYANRGDYVDAMAPGTSLVYFNNQAYLVTGTSTATAYVSGYAAALSSSTGKTMAEVEQMIRESLSIKKSP